MEDHPIDLSEFASHQAEAAAELPNPSMDMNAIMADFAPIPVPCDIYTSRSGTFIVHDFDSWGYTKVGIFASGFWRSDTQKRDRDVMIPNENVDHIEFHFEPLIAAMTDAEAAAFATDITGEDRPVTEDDPIVPGESAEQGEILDEQESEALAGLDDRDAAAGD